MFLFSFFCLFGFRFLAKCFLLSHGNPVFSYFYFATVSASSCSPPAWASEMNSVESIVNT